ncbi:SpoVG family protein [Candidatus Bipolaricaulota bacterium]|nr:SpoVG family protein [Candidatus Bipolaricaulota bacterium]MBS3814280.1 SpoVG family protein [Candidatus Bipolaricaulota bacterium]MBS3825307.1 SpoVG family protein [Candidatus Bipolaricaulota bacterium]
MEITRVEIRPMKDEGNLKSFCSVVFDDVFIIHSVKVIEGSNGLFVAMPSREVGDGEYRDTAHPIDNDFRLELEKKVLEKYREEVGEEEAEEVEVDASEETPEEETTTEEEEVEEEETEAEEDIEDLSFTDEF